ncbi:hypothetical protein V2J09_008012 [Rumex salicifolius]
MSKMKHLLRKLHIGNDHQQQHSDHHAARPSPGQTTSSPSPSSSPSESPSTSSSSALTQAMSHVPTGDSSDRPARDSFQAAAQESVSSSSSATDFCLYEEEYQVQLALALSVSDNERQKDPESDQINAARQLSLGWPLSVADNERLGEFLSRKYWNYNVVHYDEKIVDGFYDVCATTSRSISHGKMPVLADLQAVTMVDTVDYEVILVNRAIDPQLRSLENKAYSISAESRVLGNGLLFNDLIQKIADLIVDRMGGPVVDAEEMTKRWRLRSDVLMNSLNTAVFPLGLLTVGLSRHRALLFKVLSDKINLPCMLVKGSLYTGSDNGAVNLVKTVDGSEYIIDLMGAPGALIPAEIPSSLLLNTVLEMRRVADNTDNVKGLDLALDTVAITPDLLPHFDEVSSVCQPSLETTSSYGGLLLENTEIKNTNPAEGAENGCEKPALPNLSAISITPSISEEMSLAQEKKVKDVSKYVINAAKNPEFAQKLHAVLLESGASPPADLFSDINSGNSVDTKSVDQIQLKKGNKNIAPLYWSNNELSLLPPSGANPFNEFSCDNKLEENAYEEPIPQLALVANLVNPSCSELNGEGLYLFTPEANKVITYGKTVESSNGTLQGECNFESNTGIMSDKELCNPSATNMIGRNRCFTALKELNENASAVHDKEISPMLGEVAEWEIPWEDLQIGDRIGIGSYGEVYQGDWNDTEVAVKKFLVQDFTSDVLVQFKSEAEMMIRLRHPNVVLFMGAVTRPPNLSILTEFLPRGSLFKLLHRSSGHIDEKRRMKMAVDVAKGMNCLHTSHPTIVHRDLKTPNLLVDNNWVVKVCDFGLSRLKHHTFLSSKSTAGTPEWMAPEVLRNEQSNEKCDIYSFGVILWELATLRIPWHGLNPMQVVGVVGFQDKRLEIPKEVDTVVTQIIQDCWENDPSLRPSFAQLIPRLRGLKCLLRSVAALLEELEQQKRLNGDSANPASKQVEILNTAASKLQG